MSDFKVMRQNMVRGQIRPEIIADPSFMHAFSVVPREQFVPRQCARIAYMDGALALQKGQVLLKPTTFAHFLASANLCPTDRILYIGEGGGYGPALLGAMGLSVVMLSEDESEEENIMDRLRELHISSVMPVFGLLLEGWQREGPYTKIFIEGSIGWLPSTLMAQLAPEGELLCFMKREHSLSNLVKVTKKGKKQCFVSLVNAWAPSLKCFGREKSFVF